MISIREAYQRGLSVPNATYIPGLDGLRAIAVSMVIVAHAGFGHVVPGGFGVTIFFFISGLLITNLLCTEFDRNGRIAIVPFYVRRYLRLSPEMFLYVLICALLSVIFLGSISWAYFFGGLFYFTNYLKIFYHEDIVNPFTTGHLWSLAVEEHFYLTYPLLLAATVARPRRLLVALLAICVASLTIRIVAFGSLPDSYNYYASEARMDSLAYGCIGALLGRIYVARITFLQRVPVATMLAGLALLLAAIVIRSPEFRETLRYTVQGIGLLLCAVALYTPAFASLIRLLEIRPLRVLGQLSYGVYLWHFMPIQLYALLRGHELPDSMGMADRLVATVLGFAFAIGAAYPSYRFVLGAFAGLRRRFGSHGVASGGGAEGTAQPVDLPGGERGEQVLSTSFTGR